MATFLLNDCLYIRLLKVDDNLLNENSMEILTRPNNQAAFESETSFDRESRENYFENLEVALWNLSIVDRKREDQKVLIQE